MAKKANKAPRRAGKAETGRTVKVTLVRSLIGTPRDQRETAKGLGLRKPQSSAVLKETPAVRGMIEKIGYALKVETVEKP
ncbi:MAG TPA: 50S ribosomal protein L30 [Acidobacteriota bacterium]|nr:50S ribosomal protein L30 [Acidobacteriota bacterium]